MKRFGLYGFVFCVMIIAACNNNSSADKKTTDTATKEDNTRAVTNEKNEPAKAATVADGPDIGQIETDDYVLKIHQAIPFELAPKAYQPFKVKPSTRLVVLDISIRSKSATNIEMGKILIRSVVKDNKGKSYLSPWVVAAYMTDHPDPNHQAEYDAMWSDHFGAGEFHRSILLGFDPPVGEKDFVLEVPVSDKVVSGGMKKVSFSL